MFSEILTKYCLDNKHKDTKSCAQGVYQCIESLQIPVVKC